MTREEMKQLIDKYDQPFTEPTKETEPLTEWQEAKELIRMIIKGTAIQLVVGFVLVGIAGLLFLLILLPFFL